jgi:hypothetical protein
VRLFSVQKVGRPVEPPPRPPIWLAGLRCPSPRPSCLTPRVASLDILNGYGRDTEAGRQLLYGKLAAANEICVAGRKLSSAKSVARRFLLYPPAFRRHVPRIVERGPEKQVAWVAATPIVACVANEQFAGLCAVRQSPSYAVHEKPALADAHSHVAVDLSSPRLVAAADFIEKAVEPLLHGFTTGFDDRRVCSGRGDQ